MKYSPKMSLSGPAKPLFTWAQLQKQVEDNAKQPKMFPNKVKSFGYDKSVVARKAKEHQKEVEYLKQAAETEAQNAANKAAYENSVTGRVTGLLGNAFSDVKDVVKAPFLLGAHAVTGAWNNGTDIGADFQGLKNFGVDAAKGTYDSYNELGAVSHWGAALDKTYQAAKSGDVGSTLGGLLDVARSLNPVEQVYNTATDSNFTKFGKQVYDHPVFYAMDAAPGVGAAVKATSLGAKVAMVAGKVPVARAVVKAQAARGLARRLHNEKMFEGTRKAQFAKAVNRLDDPTDHFLLYQAVHALDPAVEVASRKAAKEAIDRGEAFTHLDMKESEILKSVADEVGAKYGRFTEQFVKPYQRIFEKYKEDGNFSEFNSEVKALKKRIDKDLHRVADAYDTNALAYLDDLRHRKLGNELFNEIRTRKPQMELLGYKTLDEIVASIGRPSTMIATDSIGWSKGFVAYVSKDPDAWVVRVIDGKGNTVARLEPKWLQDKKHRRAFLKKHRLRDDERTRVINDYYVINFANMDKALGNKGIKPLYFHHQDRTLHMPRENFTPDGGPSMGAGAQYKTNMTLWRDDRVERGNALLQVDAYQAGLNSFMKGEMLNAVIDAGRANAAGVRFIMKAEDMPKPDRMGKFKETLLIGKKDDGWSDWEDIIFSARANVQEWNRLHPDKPIPEVPEPRNIHAIVMDKRLAAYLKRMTGIQKEAGSVMRTATQWWKLGVLSFRPAFVTNNLIGNQLLAMINDPMIVREQIWNAAARFNKTEARDLRGNYRFLGEHFGDALETFGHTEQFDFGKFAAEGERYAGNKALHQSMKTFQTVANFGFKVTMMHEEALRSAIIIRALKKDARVQSFMKADRLPNIDGSTKMSRAFEHLLEHDPKYATKLRNDIVKGTNITMGNYSFFSPMEQRLKTVVPFYSWYRHIMRNAAREAAGPRAPLWVGMARVAEDYPELADYPSFTANFIPFNHGDPGSGRKRYLDFTNINPFATVPEVLAATGIAAGAVTGVGVTPGQGGGEVLSLINPIITAPLEMLSGRDLRTGAQIDSASIPMRIIERMPPWELGKRAFTDSYDPLKNYDPNDKQTWTTPGGDVSRKGVTPSAYSKSFNSALYRYLGFPVQDVDPVELAKLGERLRSEQEAHKYRINKLPDKPKSMLTPDEAASKGKRSKDILDLAHERGLPVPDFYWQRAKDAGAYNG